MQRIQNNFGKLANYWTLQTPLSLHWSKVIPKAEVLNSFFASCFNKSHAPIHSTEFRTTSHPSDFPVELLCDQDEITDLLASLDITKSSGPDNISARMLKYTAHSIAPAVRMLFNLSLKLGRVPSAWKSSRIIPIPKVPKAKSPDNYRPISLLSILSKTLESHVFRMLTTELEVTCPLVNTQGRSFFTISALLSTATHWFELLGTGKDICATLTSSWEVSCTQLKRACIA